MRDIVYITVDSLRADHVGYHGYERDTTPFLDSLSEHSHTFENAFTNGCYTRQAFPSMMTSRYPSVSRDGGGLSEECKTIAEVLSTNGYGTAGFHSNPYLGPEFGYHRGFNTFYDSKEEPSGLGRLRLWVRENIPSESALYRALETVFAKSQQKAGVDPGTPSVSADKITKKALDWVKSTRQGPRFLWIHYMDVHHPYTPPEQHQHPFREEPISKRRAIQLQRKMLDNPDQITQEELDDLIDLYDSEIHYFDAEAKRLVDAIRSEWGADTVFVITSDHGEEFRDHGGFSHDGTLFDELLHVPLLVSDGTGGKVYDDPVSLRDIPATLFDYADTELPDSFEGESLKSLIDDDSRERSYIIGDHGTTVAYRDRKWKYITGPDRTELYNLECDPDEKTNVLAANSEIVEQIESRLDEYPELGTAAESDVDKADLEDEVQNRLEQLGYLAE